MTLRVKWMLLGMLFGAVAGAWGGVRLFCPGPPPVPLAPGEVKQLGDAGFKPAEDAPLEDATPDLPGTPAGTVVVTMRRHATSRDAMRRPVTPVTGVTPVTPSEPGRAGETEAPPLVEPSAPAPIPAGLTADDLWGNATVDLRQAGPDLWTRATLTCCAGEVCRSEVGAETEARFDRAALCGRARRLKLTELRLGGWWDTAEEAGVRLGVSRYREGSRWGWWAEADAELLTEDLTVYDAYVSDGYPGVRERIVSGDRDYRFAGGLSIRIGG